MRGRFELKHEQEERVKSMACASHQNKQRTVTISNTILDERADTRIDLLLHHRSVVRRELCVT
jgi:hypothetical protein